MSSAFCVLNAQNPNISTDSDLSFQEHIETLYDKGNKARFKDYPLYRSYADSILTLSEENDYLKGKCYAYQMLGSYFFYTSSLDSAYNYFIKSFESRVKLGDSVMVSTSLNSIGNVYDQKGESINAIDFYERSINYSPSYDTLWIAGKYESIGRVYCKHGDYASAMENNNKALEVFKNYDPESTDYADVVLNRANILIAMLEIDQASALLNKSKDIYIKNQDNFSLAVVNQNIASTFLRKGMLDSARTNYQSSFDFYQSIGSLQGQAENEQNLGIVARLKGEYSEAKEYLNNSLKKWVEIGNPMRTGFIFVELGKFYLDSGQYLKAIDHFKKSTTFYELNADYLYDVNIGISKALQGLGRYQEAIPYHTKCLNLKDSVNFEKIQWKNLESDYREEINRLRLLEKENSLLIEKEKRAKLIRYTLIAAFILFIIAVSIFIWIRHIKTKKNLALKEAKIKSKELESLQKDKELASIRNVLEIQDSERKRIGKELHDRLGVTLSLVKLHFQNTTRTIEELKEATLKEYNKATSLLDDAFKEVRTIAFDLSSGVLYTLGLIPAIQELIDALENSGNIEVEFVTYKFEERIAPKYEDVIFRIVQELIANVLKHSSANQVSVQLLKKEKEIQLEVWDNGSGFDLKTIEEKSGMGYKNIKTRLSTVDGKLSVDSQIGSGSTIIINIPYPS